MKVLKGIAASPGQAMGPVFIMKKERTVLPGTCEDSEIEWRRFETAAKQVADHLTGLSEKIRTQAGAEAGIFNAYAGMVDDPVLLEKIKEYIFREKWNAGYAVCTAVETFAGELESSGIPALAARGDDLREVAHLVIRQLRDNLASSGLDTPAVAVDAVSPPRPSMIVAKELSFIDTAKFERSMVLGYCLAEGGSGGHTAILARASGIPAVVGIGPGVLIETAGKTVLLDGNEGTVIIEPDAKTRAEFEKREARRVSISTRVMSHASEPAVTRDGFEVKVFANIGDEENAEEAVRSGAEGVGLFRTEFLCAANKQLPDEERQYRVYTNVISRFKGKPVILRTFDLGGDKTIPFPDLPRENNPFLGLRGIRLALAYYDTLLKPQLRAVIRAGQTGDLKLMLPMISCKDEITAVRARMAECSRQLIGQGYDVSRDVPVGIMVETPAAAIMAPTLAEAVDFFSIGTNDLTQYTMAADRTNPAVSNLISGIQPAVLGMIHHIVQGAASSGKLVGVCGELAGEPLAIPLLVGLGVGELSVNPRIIPITKHIIRQVTKSDAREIALRALRMDNHQDVGALVKKKIPLSPQIGGER